MPKTALRQVGSGFSSFSYAGKPIAWLDRVQDSGQRPLGAAYEAITPIGARVPQEIVPQRVLGEGTLVLTIRELWNQPVWWQLSGMTGTHDIGAVYEALAANPNLVTCQTVIKPPGVGPDRWRGKEYHYCVITGIDDSETIETAALTVPKTITIVYAYSTPLGGRRAGSPAAAGQGVGLL